MSTQLEFREKRKISLQNKNNQDLYSIIRDYLICITVQIGGGSLEVASDLYK